MITAIVQARMSSTRLPGKVLKNILGKPMLWHLIRRLQKSEAIQKIVVATSVKEIDHPILDAAQQCGADVYAGSEDDVLDRYYQAAKLFYADPIVRITADCPLIDPNVTDAVVRYFIANKEKVDYVSNAAPPTYPDGLDTEVFSFATLKKAWKEASSKSDREYPTMYMFKNKEKFRLANVQNSENLSHLRWTVDEERDFLFVTEIYKKLQKKEDDIFYMKDIIRLLKAHPEMMLINKGIKRNEGYIISMKKEGVDIKEDPFSIGNAP